MNDSPETGGPADQLLPKVYGALRELARHRLSTERAGHTLQATALVHEVYLRLADSPDFATRGHFFAAAAEAMRRILIEHARGRGRLKRGGNRVRLDWANVLDLASVPDASEILAFDEAMRRLEEKSSTAAAVVRLRFFAGLTVAESARVLNCSPRSVDREWTYARAFLFQLLDDRG